MHIYDSNNQLLAANDDSQECQQDSLISNLGLNIGSEYTVVLGGYNNQVGTYAIELICPCESSVTELQCGVAQTGSTANSCNAEQLFVFTATTNIKTISACGSEF